MHFQVQAWRPVINFSANCLPSWSYSWVYTGEQPLSCNREILLLPLSTMPRPPTPIYLIQFPAKQLVNTFTHETNYDRIKASPALFCKLNYWDSDWILKSLFLSHSSRKMNPTCCEASATWCPYVATGSWKRGEPAWQKSENRSGDLSWIFPRGSREHGTQEHDLIRLAAEIQRIWSSPFVHLFGYDSLEKLQRLSYCGHFMGSKS